MAQFKQHIKLGEILVKKKIISAKELDDILEQQKASKQRLGEFIVTKGIATEEEIFQALADYFGYKYHSKLEFHDSGQILNKIPIFFLKKNKLVPFNVIKKIILVAISDPLNIQPLDDLNMMYPGYTFEPVLTSDEEIQKIINNNFSGPDSADVLDEMDESDLDMLGSQISETEDILDMANEAPIIKLVNKILTEAVDDRASDIHIEPYEKELVVRYRIDGILYHSFDPPKKLQNAITSRIKIMSNLNIAENRLPQDGRIQIKVGSKDIDIRVSIFPTHYGERIVMRLLNKSDAKFELEGMGFEKKILEQFQKLYKKPHGILLVTGPTGSGKSTTLYSVLSKLNNPDVNILTVEDPIEYQLHGIGQMQVNAKIDLTFAAGLRSILRQDPDIIMIGEIRDLETAEIAIQSALTGHSVFSTLHTNDAASGVTRLVDMGVEPFLIASSVNGILAQRLIRKICPKCKTAYKPNLKELKEVGLKSTQLKNGKLFIGKGCKTCLNTGYQGRTGIYELLPITNDIRKLIVSHADASAIKEVALKNKMKTLLQSGLEKAIKGETTLEEVIRVSGV